MFTLTGVQRRLLTANKVFSNTVATIFMILPNIQLLKRHPYLLIHGNLPTQAQLDEFDSELKGARELPEKIFDVIDLVKDSHPMDVLRTAVSALPFI
ncbi:MAG: hypothetical protein CM1200mP39_03350 [Dehalococcoidia bacterium]|nr:MAG: hypothetical protein CM1200mP39_03350 [Dehalococcoidia bacterium]